MTNKPKLIYKYTHEQAVANGELRLLDVDTRIYLGYQLDAKAKRYNLCDDDFLCAISGVPLKHGRQTIHSLKAFNFDAVLGYEIRDDDKFVPCLTLVCEGEA